MRSGRVNPGVGLFWVAGLRGYDWASRANVSSAAHIVIYPDSLNINGSSNQYDAFSLRCLAD